MNTQNTQKTPAGAEPRPAPVAPVQTETPEVSKVSISPILIGVIAVLILFVIAVMISFGMNIIQFTAVDQDEAGMVVETSEMNTSESGVTSLADAINLLPEPEYAVSGREMSEGMYWVWVRKPIENETTHPDAWKTHDESWVVNVNTGTASMVSEYDFMVPYGPIVSHIDASDDYFYIHWQAAYEGPYTDVKEYINKESGELKVRLTANGPNSVKIENNSLSLNIQHSPKDICGDVSFEDMEAVRTLDGIDVNGELISLGAPIDVNCIYNDMIGEAYNESFNNLAFWESDNIIRLNVTSSGLVIFDADTLELQSATLR